jgi:putative FmdB family regulatory protein
MPAYTYECSLCTEKFNSFHSMNEQLEICEKCGQRDCLKKIPSLLTSYTKQRSDRELAGERVEREIEEKRKLLLDHKKEYAGKDYKP